MPLELCEGRDPKGLYKLARAGKIKGEYIISKYFPEFQMFEIEAKEMSR